MGASLEATHPSASGGDVGCPKSIPEMVAHLGLSSAVLGPDQRFSSCLAPNATSVSLLAQARVPADGNQSPNQSAKTTRTSSVRRRPAVTRMRRVATVQHDETSIGKVVDVFSGTGTYDVMQLEVLEGEKKGGKLLVPFAREIVPEVDLDAQVRALLGRTSLSFVSRQRRSSTPATFHSLSRFLLRPSVRPRSECEFGSVSPCGSPVVAPRQAWVFTGGLASTARDALHPCVHPLT